jgi:hypothetical protein
MRLDTYRKYWKLRKSYAIILDLQQDLKHCLEW